MVPPPEDAPHVLAEDAATWRAWLAEHAERERGAWLVTWRKGSGRPVLPYAEGVEQALCFGWVDSTGRTVDAERTKLWYAPRKARSGWSRPNKERVERLLAARLMAPAGLAVVERAKADGSWSMLDEVEDLVVPPDLAEAFDRFPSARAHWDAFPRSARRGILEWIVQAKRPATRAARIAQTAELAERGERANQWRPKQP